MPTTSGNWQKSLWPGIDLWFNERYNAWEPKYPDIFFEKESAKQFEQAVGMSLFGQAPVKAEGASIEYDTTQQTYVNQFNNFVYAKGVTITKEAYDDNQYNLDALSERPEALAFAMRVTKEVIAANVFNNGFSNSYTMGSTSDSVALFSTAHLNGPFGSNGSNNTTAADLSETALENMLVAIMTVTDPRGLNIAVMPDSLVVPPNLVFDAHRILDSQLQNDTANNAINVLRAEGFMPGGIKVNPYLTDTDAWFVVTNVTREGKGMICYNRWDMEFAQDNDFDTMNMRVRAAFRCSFGWADWRGAWGNAGA